ncbi:hypothetical protein NDU88_002261 [Pleurodeles waltl]|uniref:DDE Tnp4 domain-containing protein n=1 Tax=Pleurodeles waltl TaxID=8319 RepID=A0AAV7TM33_PLEWA|nr:hypothetical protein NDU88_002261 [Pleurodeles waltl]
MGSSIRGCWEGGAATGVAAVAGVVTEVSATTRELPSEEVEDLVTVKAEFYAMGHIPIIVGAIDGTHIAIVPPRQNEQMFRNRDSGYPNLPWLLTPVRNARTRAEERYDEARGRTRRIIERTFGLLKARFRCRHLTSGFLCYSPKKVSQIVVACCMLHNLAFRCQVPFLQEKETGDACVAAVDPVDSEDKEVEDEDEDEDNRTSVIRQCFQ